MRRTSTIAVCERVSVVKNKEDRTNRATVYNCEEKTILQSGLFNRPQEAQPTQSSFAPSPSHLLTRGRDRVEIRQNVDQPKKNDDDDEPCYRQHHIGTHLLERDRVERPERVTITTQKCNFGGNRIGLCFRIYCRRQCLVSGDSRAPARRRLWRRHLPRLRGAGGGTWQQIGLTLSAFNALNKRLRILMH